MTKLLALSSKQGRFVSSKARSTLASTSSSVRALSALSALPLATLPSFAPNTANANTNTARRSIHSPSSYGSLGEPLSSTKLSSPAAPWQAEHNVDVQRVTQQALVYELTRQSSQTLERVVPWFLSNMPSSYFKQVPEPMRIDHIRAIAAVFSSDPATTSVGGPMKWNSSNLHLNLKSTTPDGRIVWTFIRPGTKAGTLLSMVEEQKHLDMTSTNASEGTMDGSSSSSEAAADKGQNKLPLTRLHVFSSKDESVSLNMFVYGHKTFSDESSPQAASTFERMSREDSHNSIISLAKTQVQSGLWREAPYYLHPDPLFEEESLREYMTTQCSDNYVNIGQKVPARFLRQRLMVDHISGTEGSAVHIEPAGSGRSGGAISTLEQEDVNTYDSRYYWIDVAISNSLPQIALEHTCRLLYMHQLDVSRARLDIIRDGDNGRITMLRLLVRSIAKDAESVQEISTADVTVSDDDSPAGEEQLFPLLAQELKRAKWLDPSTINLVYNSHIQHRASQRDANAVVSIVQGEIITAMANLMHPILVQRDSGDAIRYSKSSILDTLTQKRVVPWAIQIADLFLERFHPKHPLKDDQELHRRMDALKEQISKNVEQTLAVELLDKMMDVLAHTLKTNIYMQDRYALGLRLDPTIMMEQSAAPEDVPFGIFFVHGRRFNGYHVRFRDISRGGMRLVTPASSEQLALESARQFEECYGLAFAQQLKNKDIPEGGSKAVCLIDTVDLTTSSSSDADTKNFCIRKSVKAFTDTILDMVVVTDETKEHIVDYWGRPEVLYLGPDEQVLPEDINWIIERAGKRGYNTPAAFMSSKPRAGINHKEYGVTSEGVNVYLDVALRRTLNINPNEDSFTIKMTGGPDGDVGGNEIKILIREYGDNCKIIGVADHSGCAEDPEGLDHDELSRLVEFSLPIGDFNPSKLKSTGIVHTVDKEEGVKARNSMHNRLIADAFLPCGGRPNTIDKTNYQKFLLDDGKTPSSRLIVEGANLFVTAEARQALWEQAGVVIVKDSSANKGGVITSSYEICAAMLLGEEEFFANKDEIVGQVLTKLRGMAQLEAELLFREKDSYGEASLPQVSQIISNSINAATDALTAALSLLSQDDRNKLLPLFRAHLPPKMADMSFDHVHERVPAQYIQNAIASCLASKLVYKEGTKFIDSQPRKNLAKIALEYVEKEQEMALLMQAIQNTDMPEEEKERVMALLDAGGARTALSMH